MRWRSLAGVDLLRIKVVRKAGRGSRSVGDPVGGGGFGIERLRKGVVGVGSLVRMLGEDLEVGSLLVAERRRVVVVAVEVGT